MSGAPTTLGGTQVTGGVGGTTFGMLSSIGSDLSVSVSFNIASELLYSMRKPLYEMIQRYGACPPFLCRLMSLI